MDIHDYPPDMQAIIREAIQTGIQQSVRPNQLQPRQKTNLLAKSRPDAPMPYYAFYPDLPADMDGANFRGTPYPALMWHRDSGQELCVYSVKEQAQKEGEGYTRERPPDLGPIPTAQSAAHMLEGLSEEEKDYILHGAHEQRLAAAKDLIAGLSKADYASLMKSLGVEPKRGPGRPRKVPV